MNMGMDLAIGVLLGQIDGFLWWMMKPPGKPGIAIDISTKTIKKDTYASGVWCDRQGMSWNGPGDSLKENHQLDDL